MAPPVPNRWTTHPAYIDLLNYLIQKAKDAKSPMSIHSLAKRFKEKSGAAQTVHCLKQRIEKLRTHIYSFEHIDTNTKVNLIFALSAPVKADFFKKLNKDALVKVDEKKRITDFKANDGSLELRGDHSLSAKEKTAWIESKRSLRSLIINYFETKGDADAISKNKEEKEMENLIEFITEKCVNIDTPLSIFQLAKGFKMRFGKSVSSATISYRIRGYGREIQKMESLDTLTKVKQLFCLSASVDSDYLEKLRKDAVVKVDEMNRITKYTANDGSLTLHGDHSQSAKNKLSWIVRRKTKKRVKKPCISDSGEDEESEEENGYSDNDSDEYSSEEFGSDIDSDDENDPLDEPDHMDSSNKVIDFDNETPVSNRSASEMSIDDSFDFDPPTEKSHRSEETERGEDEDNDSGITGHAPVKTRFGRLSKRKHLDTEFSYNFAKSRSSEVSMNTDSSSLKPAKQKKMKIDEEQALNSSSLSRRSSKSKRSSRNFSFSTFTTEPEENMENQDTPRAEENPSDYHGPRIQEMDDYDYNPREDNTPESFPIDNRLGEPELSAAKDNNTSIESQNTDNRTDVDAPEPKPEKESLTPQNNKNSTPPTNGKEVISQEVPIKVENGEPVGNPSKDVKPETTHNFKIKFFNAMKSLILSLDTPFLSNLQSTIKQKIRKIGRSGEMISNDEMILALELLIARMTNHSVIDISEGVKSVSLIQFFCYLKASILNSKMIGVEGLMHKISGLIEKSQNKRISMEKVANALRATLDIDDF